MCKSFEVPNEPMPNLQTARRATPRDQGRQWDWWMKAFSSCCCCCCKVLVLFSFMHPLDSIFWPEGLLVGWLIPFKNHVKNYIVTFIPTSTPFCWMNTYYRLLFSSVVLSSSMGLLHYFYFVPVYKCFLVLTCSKHVMLTTAFS